MNSVSKVKIAVGYTLLLAVMFFSLFFVNREMETLCFPMTGTYSGQTVC